MHAEVLVLDDSATGWDFRLLCAALLVLLGFLSFGHLNEYASGPAFVQLDGRTMLAANAAGVVSKVEVKPGDRVEAGDVLVRFHAAEEIAELQAASKEFDSQLSKLLLRPSDAATREALVALRARRELANERLQQRTLRAPQRGVIGDVSVREAQLVEPGARVLDLQSGARAATIIALLPGRYRPLLHAGDKLRFEVQGFQQRALELTLSRVGDQIIGPGEAARYLGSDLSDMFSIDGPVVLVEAKLPQTWFEVDRKRYDYANGMPGKVDAVVRDEPIAVALIPGLSPWVDRAKSWLSKLERWRHGR